MKEHIKRVDRILKYKGSILDIYTDVIETPDGHRAEWDYIDHRGAAAVVPVLDDGRLLMVRQYRDALDRETIEIPAGGLNGWDEPTINAAARELEEETGYRSDNLTKLVSVVTAVAFCNEVVDVYLATDLVKTSHPPAPSVPVCWIATPPKLLASISAVRSTTCGYPLAAWSASCSVGVST